MRLKYSLIEKLKKELLEIIGKRLNLRKFKVFFFGSRVDERSGERADIDVGIEGPEPLSAEVFLDIQEEIENLPTLYKIDIVDFAKVDEKFKKVALQNIESIN